MSDAKTDVQHPTDAEAQPGDLDDSRLPVGGELGRRRSRAIAVTAIMLAVLAAGSYTARTALAARHRAPVSTSSEGNDQYATLGQSAGKVSATPAGLPPSSGAATRRSDGGGTSGMPTPATARQEQATDTAEAQSATSSKLLTFKGGAVQTSPRIYLVLWGPTWATTAGDPVGVASRLHYFYKSVSGSSVTNVLREYKGVTGGFVNATGQYQGFITDRSSVPANPTANDMANAARRAAMQVNDYSYNAQYVIATPWGVVDQRSTQLHACAWHTWVAVGSGWVTYTGMPYTPFMDALHVGCGSRKVTGNVLDGVTINALHEYAESVTDPGLNAWTDLDGSENGDKCSWTSLATIKLTDGAVFPGQPLWSNSWRRSHGSGCVYVP